MESSRGRHLMKDDEDTAASDDNFRGLQKSSFVRTTVVLPVALDANLGVYALQHNLQKGKVVAQLLDKYLRKEGFQPDKMPREIVVSY